MDIVSKYTALLGQQKLKESFVKDLELVLSRKNPNIEKGKLNFIRYSEMKNWSVRELFGEDLEQADRALINKVYHMLFDIGSDFESVIRMLYSFRNGPKSGIKVADPEDNYEWTNKDGNEKYSTKNLLCFGISPLLGAVLVQYRVQQGQRMVRELLHWRHAQQH